MFKFKLIFDDFIMEVGEIEANTIQEAEEILNKEIMPFSPCRSYVLTEKARE